MSPSCSCHGPDQPMCSLCVGESLKEPLERQRNALEDRNWRRKWCGDRLHSLSANKGYDRQIQVGREGDGTPTHVSSRIDSAAEDALSPARIKAEADRLRSVLSSLVRKCNSAAIEHDQLTISNNVREEKVDLMEQHLIQGQNGFHRLYTSEESGLIPALESATNDALARNREIRLRLVGQAFEMHRIDVGKENDLVDNVEQSNQRSVMKLLQRNPRGIGKIGGLPLPHAGPVLYGALPPGVLASALRMVASLTSILSRILGVVLPHPILLRPMSDDLEHSCDIAAMSMFRNFPSTSQQAQSFLAEAEPEENYLLEDKLSHSTLSTPGGATTSLSSWSLRGAAAAALSRTSRAFSYSTASSSSPLQVETSASKQSNVSRSRHQRSTMSMDQGSVRNRVKHATAAVIRESQEVVLGVSSRRNIGEGGRPPEELASTAVTEFVLNPYHPNRMEEFNVGLQFLQNDVLALCIHADVPISTLWPGEALLLNLNALRLYCSRELQSP